MFLNCEDCTISHLVTTRSNELKLVALSYNEIASFVLPQFHLSENRFQEEIDFTCKICPFFPNKEMTLLLNARYDDINNLFVKGNNRWR